MTKTQKTLALVLVLLVAGACGKKIPVLVAETGLRIAQTLDRAVDTNKALVQNGTYAPEVGLAVQAKLDAAGAALKPLPGLLRAIHFAQTTNSEVNAGDVEAALRVVESAAKQLNLAVQDVPVADVAKQLLDLLAQSTATLNTIRGELDKLKAPAASEN